MITLSDCKRVICEGPRKGYTVEFFGFIGIHYCATDWQLVEYTSPDGEVTIHTREQWKQCADRYWLARIK